MPSAASVMSGEWAATEMAHAVEHWRKQFRGDAPMKDDTAITDEDISSHNLVLWGDPASNGALTRIHSAISAAIDPAHCRPHYRPGAWTPHCTLGTRIADERHDDAIAFARSYDGRIEVLFDVVDCVAFPPVRIISEQRLPS